MSFSEDLIMSTENIRFYLLIDRQILFWGWGYTEALIVLMLLCPVKEILIYSYAPLSLTSILQTYLNQFCLGFKAITDKFKKIFTEYGCCFILFL